MMRWRRDRAPRSPQNVPTAVHDSTIVQADGDAPTSPQPPERRWWAVRHEDGRFLVRHSDSGNGYAWSHLEPSWDLAAERLVGWWEWESARLDQHEADAQVRILGGSLLAVSVVALSMDTTDTTNPQVTPDA